MNHLFIIYILQKDELNKVLCRKVTATLGDTMERGLG